MLPGSLYFSLVLTTLYLSFSCVLYIGDCSAVVGGDEQILNISLENYDVSTDGYLIKDFVQIPRQTTLLLNVVDIPNSIRFIIVQAHAFQFNVTLSYNAVLKPHFYIEGTNLGLVQLLNNNLNNAEFYIGNQNARTNVSILITVQGYSVEAPIPGGCNMEFSVETAPYLSTSYTESIVLVDSQPASPPSPRNKPAPSCEPPLVQHEMYHMYLPERDFSAETYFNALLSMMTVRDIQLNGVKVSEPVEGSHMRRIYSAYPGTGSVYAVIAKSGTSAAAYVPSLTYGCSTVYWTDSCEVLKTTFSKVLCAVIFFLGLFVCFYGHQFFKTEMFLLGFLSGGLVFYILIAVFTSLNASVTIVLSVILGLCFGSLWLGIWWFYGIPVFSVLLATLTLGFVVSAVSAYGWLGDVDVLRSDLNFWMVYSCTVLVVPVLFLSLIQKANVISCAFLGAYAVIIPIDHYIGSNLKYIIVNVIRRATVSNFRMAVVDPPFQTRDTILCIVWISLAVIGIIIQLHKQRGKPPFPPPPYLKYREHFRRSRFPCNTSTPTENTPLLTEASIAPTRIPYYISSAGNDDVFESPQRSPKFFSFLNRLQQTA